MPEFDHEQAARNHIAEAFSDDAPPTRDQGIALGQAHATLAAVQELRAIRVALTKEEPR